MKSPYKMNKYGVDMEVLNGLGVRSIGTALLDKDIIVIDEIGSMEIL